MHRGPLFHWNDAFRRGRTVAQSAVRPDGVDVGAIAELHHVINELADAGLAVVVISSYLPEILNLADRILVSRQGRIVEEFSVEEATEEKIMYAAVH